MPTSTTTSVTLSAFAIIFIVNVFAIFMVHREAPSKQQQQFIDHRHQGGHIPDSTSFYQRFYPVIIQSEHLAKETSPKYYLPDALRYPLYANLTGPNPTGSCCQMASLRGKRPVPNNIQCDGICHTERACNDPLYPFKTEREAHFFREREWNVSELPFLRRKCTQRNELLQPPFKWCRQWLSIGIGSNGTGPLGETVTATDLSKLDKYNHRNIHPYEANLPPPGCSRISEGGGSGPYQHLTLFPSAKLAFCGIPKISITQWLQFLRFTFGAKDYLAFPHAKPDVKLMRFDKLGEESQRQILNDPEWKFAVFLRNPAERLLSAYLDKVNGKSSREREHFQFLYNMSYSPSFEEFVTTIAKNRSEFGLSSRTKLKLQGVDWLTDPHWRPQSFSCGLSEFLPRFSYVGSLDHIEEQAKALLQDVGLWNDYGKYYHKGGSSNDLRPGICGLKPPSLKVGDELSGFLQVSKSKNDTDENKKDFLHSHHSTGSQSKLNQYYTPELKAIVEKKLYPMDFKLWNLVDNEENLVSGSELAVRISEECESVALQLMN